MTNKPMLSVERDERADFEKEVQARAERFQPDFRRYGLHPDAEYKCANNQWAWELWQKRASMDKPAAQHQGEPVETVQQYRVVRHDPRDQKYSDWYEIESDAKREQIANSLALTGMSGAPAVYELRTLYAEQPAPVAVVMPERKTKADYSGYIEQFQSEAAGLYNSALDDVARLNGVKP